jgi:DNA-nicking Smr family endonuclease
MSRRPKPRKLSAEDHELWSRVTQAAKPLHPARKSKPLAEPKASVAALKSSSAPVSAPSLTGVHRPTPRRAEPPTAFHPAPSEISSLGPGAPGLDKRTAERLRKGRTPPEARIDLHGMTADRAQGALVHFIENASRNGLRCVLVITGKGTPTSRHSDDADFMGSGRGVLRRDAPRWLRSPPLGPLVVGVYQAHPKHGGAGALYVYLKRRR